MESNHVHEEDVWKEMFTRTADEPIVWLVKAKELNFAAKILLPKLEEGTKKIMNMEEELLEEDFYNSWLTSTLMMLLGYSLEVLIKGIYLINNKTIVTNGTLNRWPGNGHSLLQLVEFVNKSDGGATITLSKDEQYLLIRLSEFTIWAGKYPIPKNYKTKMPQEMSDGSRVILTSFISGDIETFDRLFIKLSTYYEANSS
ncbi:hypothetical protein AB4114_29605 [Paenibacillus sp. 2RAB27]|uniref:hypothetical protein n=1 Tax=Paenibacillus sp. 2RAB27 TaxID=3232991 RepID=UPI003F9B9CA4